MQHFAGWWVSRVVAVFLFDRNDDRERSLLFPSADYCATQHNRVKDQIVSGKAAASSALWWDDDQQKPTSSTIGCWKICTIRISSSGPSGSMICMNSPRLINLMQSLSLSPLLLFHSELKLLRTRRFDLLKKLDFHFFWHAKIHFHLLAGGHIIGHCIILSCCGSSFDWNTSYVMIGMWSCVIRQ